MKTHAKMFAVALVAATASTAFAQREMAVTVMPLKHVAEKVAGEDWKCAAVVGQGQDPHMFEPTPRLVEQLRGCEVYFQIGMPFEKVLIGRLAKINPAMKVVDMDMDGPHEESEEDGHAHEEGEADADHGHGDHGHSHEGGLDPHGWMSMQKLAGYAAAVEAELAERDPKGADGYKRRSADFRKQLETLRGEFSGRLAKAEVKAIAAYHPAWGHFAKEFGLEQIAVENDGKTPGPRHLESVAAKLKEQGVRTILVQNAREGERIAAFAKRQGLAVVEVSVLGDDPIAAIRATVDALCSADPAK